MKKFGLLVSFLAFVFLFNLMFSACKPASKKSEELPAEPSSKLSEEFIDMDLVTKDSLTGLFVFKDDSRIVTGIVVQKHWDNRVREDSVILKMVIEDGIAKQINEYFLNGSLFMRYSNDRRKIDTYSRSGKLMGTKLLDSNFQDSINYSYMHNGSISTIVLMDRENKKKIVRKFSVDLQSKVTVYNEKNEVMESYNLDENGHIILPYNEETRDFVRKIYFEIRDLDLSILTGSYDKYKKKAPAVVADLNLLMTKIEDASTRNKINKAKKIIEGRPTKAEISQASDIISKYYNEYQKALEKKQKDDFYNNR